MLVFRLFFCSFCFFSIAFGYELNNAISDALASNNTIIAARQQSKAVQFSSRSALSEFLPSVSLVANVDPTFDDFTYYNKGQLDNKISSPNFSIQVQQNLFRYGSSLAKIKKGYHDYRAQEFSSQEKIQNVILSVVNAYLELLRASQTVILYSENVKALEKAQDAEEKKLKFGESTVGSVSQAKSKLSSARSEYIQSQSDAQNKRATLLRLIGKEVKGHLSYPEISTKKLPKTLSGAIEIARKNNSGLNAAYNTKKSLEFAKASVISSAMPSLDLITKFTYGTAIKNNQPGNYENKEFIRMFALNFTIPLFHGGADYMAIGTAVYNKMYGDSIYMDANNALVENVTIAWNDYKNSTSIINAAIDLVKLNEITVDSIKKEANLNLKTGVDVIDAEVDLLRARVQLLKAQNFQVNALYRLLVMVYGNSIIGDLNA